MEQYLYVARDKDNTLAVFNEKPKRNLEHYGDWSGVGMPIDKNMFPTLKWEDEPLLVVLQQALFKSKEKSL